MAYIAEPNATVSWNGQCGQRIMLLIRCTADRLAAVSQAISANSSALTSVQDDGTKRSFGLSSGRSKISTATCPPSQPQ